MTTETQDLTTNTLTSTVELGDSLHVKPAGELTDEELQALVAARAKRKAAEREKEADELQDLITEKEDKLQAELEKAYEEAREPFKTQIQAIQALKDRLKALRPGSFNTSKGAPQTRARLTEQEVANATKVHAYRMKELAFGRSISVQQAAKACGLTLSTREATRVYEDGKKAKKDAQ